MEKHLIKIIFFVVSSLLWSFSKAQYEQEYCEEIMDSLYISKGVLSAYDYVSKPITVSNNRCKPFGAFIRGGEEAQPKEFPHAALLGNHDRQTGKVNKWFCGGTLISDKFVLTASHCLYTAFGNVTRVRLGELDFGSDTDDADPEDFAVKKITPYQANNDDSDDESLYHDIALIELDRSVRFNLYKHPACLPLSYDEGTKSTFIAIGWGNTDFAKPPSDHLLKVDLDPFDDNRCNRFITNSRSSLFPRGLDTDTQICAGSTQGKDTCSGDSGGPLLVRLRQNRCMHKIVAVTSSGVALCGIGKAPGIYTRVFPYADWIRNIVWPGK